ncbi:hypothetical protein BDE02_08G188100 [Populus trichocarpa]|nr:hypothetical protein BDE02_08G188100 [Populus trichocarpa]
MLQGWIKLGPKSAKKLVISGSSQHFPPFLLSPPCLQPLKPPHTPFSSTNRRQRNLPTNPNPHQWQNSHRDCDRRASPLQLLLSPATDTSQHSLHRSLLSHWPNLLIAAKLPPQVNLLPLPFLLLRCLLSEQ